MSNFIELIEKSLLSNKGLEFIEQEIKLLFKTIANTSELREAELLFKNLEDIQFVLAKALFKNGTEVTSFLRNFVHDFDRIDDTEVKKTLYDRIKSRIIDSM